MLIMEIPIPVRGRLSVNRPPTAESLIYLTVLLDICCYMMSDLNINTWKRAQQVEYIYWLSDAMQNFIHSSYIKHSM